MFGKYPIRRLLISGLLLVGISATTLEAQRVILRTRHFGPSPRAHFRPYRTVIVGNWGEVDFNVEPQQSKIFVDGAYLGIADDLNGWPSHARLKAGQHQVRIVAPNGKTYQTRIYVQPGKELNFNYHF